MQTTVGMEKHKILKIYFKTFSENFTSYKVGVLQERKREKRHEGGMKRKERRDFPRGTMVKILLPMQGTRV